MDSEAFLPLTSEEMTSTLGRRVVQFCDIVDALTEKLVAGGYADVKGLRATGGSGWYGRYLRLKGYGAVLQFNAWNWSKWGESSIWIGIKGEDWKPSAKVREALTQARIEFREYTAGNDECRIPIRLRTGAEREDVIRDALLQLYRIMEALPFNQSTPLIQQLEADPMPPNASSEPVAAL